MKAAIYTRVSTKHEEQLSSLENQEEHYIEYCANNGYEMVKLYKDEGLSATSPNRKEFLEMLYDAGLDAEKKNGKVKYFEASEDRKPKFEWIITKDVSRFARNIDAMALVKELVLNGVHVLFENAGFSTNDTDWELRLSLLLTFSQQESLDRAKKVSFAYKQRSKSKIFHLARNLYGYNYDPLTKEVSIKEEEAAIVRKMFDLFINDGLGVKSISNYLNENGILTQNGKEWVGGNVRRLLRNEKYIGRVILNKYTNTGITSGNKKIKRPEEEWITHDDLIPAIIDIETWNKAQEIIQLRAAKTNENSLTGSRKVKNIFYGKLYCAKCGKPYVRVAKTKKTKSQGKVTQVNYMCANRRQRASCDNTMISHNVLVEKITEFGLNELPKELEYKSKLFNNIYASEISLLEMRIKVSNRSIEKLKKRMTEIDSEVDKLLTSFSKSNSIIVTTIENKILSLNEEKEDLSKKILENDVVNLSKEIEKLKQFKKKLSASLKERYSFEETLGYLGKITAEGRKLEFSVVADSKLEPMLNIDMSRIADEKSFDRAIEAGNEALEILKRLGKNNLSGK